MAEDEADPLGSRSVAIRPHLALHRLGGHELDADYTDAGSGYARTVHSDRAAAVSEQPEARTELSPPTAVLRQLDLGGKSSARIAACLALESGCI
jgi:hypothetical protein